MAIDLSKVKDGDKLAFEGVVVAIAFPYRKADVCVKWPCGDTHWVCSADAISHTPAPREFKPGDQVTWGNGSEVYEFREARNGESCLWNKKIGYFYHQPHYAPLRHADDV